MYVSLCMQPVLIFGYAPASVILSIIFFIMDLVVSESLISYENIL
jgi:hypothetical protein